MKKTSFSNVKMLLGVIVCLLFAGQIVKADVVYSEATKVPNLSSDLQEMWPQVSRDGLEMYLEVDDDIWVSKRSTVSEPWSTPVALDGPVNSASHRSTPSISADGLELYFADDKRDGSDDLYVSTRASRDDAWGAPKNLGPTINSGHGESSPSISADGLELYFMSSVSDNPRNSEILVSVRASKDSPWGEPLNLGYGVNSIQYEGTPFISPDGLSLFFSRGYNKSHIWVSHRSSIAKPWTLAKFFEPVNTGSFTDVWGTPPYGAEYSLSYADGDPTLYFCHAGSFFTDDFDIWQVKVTPILDFDGDGSVDLVDVLMLTDHWETNNSLYDIAPTPFGDGIVDAKDLQALAEYMVQNETTADGSDPGVNDETPVDTGDSNQDIEAKDVSLATITATASSSNNADEGPEKTIDGSGLNDQGQHSTEVTDMWLSGTFGAPHWIQYEFDGVYKLNEMHVWNHNQVIEPFIGIGAKDVLIETSVDGVDWTTLEGTTQFNQATGSADYTANTIVDFGGIAARFVRINILSGYGMWAQWGLSEVRFF